MMERPKPRHPWEECGEASNLQGVYSTMSENGSENTNTRDAAERYLRAGLAVIPVPAGEKNPNRRGWQNERHTVEDVPRLWTNGQGIGVLWGEPSGGLVDVDLDWREARVAARHILPATRTFGRPGAPESHRVYRVTDTIPKSKKYKIGGDGPERCAVEVLSTGTQSLVPPSLHDSGERREWHREQTAAELSGEALMEGVADVATAALIARNWPGQGARHDYALAATGYIGRRLPRERAERVMEAAIAASGDEEANGRLRDVRGTLDKLPSGASVTGGWTLERLARGLVEQLQLWHGWGGGRSATSAGPHEPDDLNSIIVNDRPLRDIGDEALQALETRNTPPTLFARAGKVIRLGQDENDAPIIQEAGEPVIRHHLARAANFVHVRERKSGTEETHVHPPRDVVQDVLSVPHLPFPPLIGVPRTPFFRLDGTIVDELGYDASTRLYYVPACEGFAVDVPDKPSADDLGTAVALLDEAAGDFPYNDEASAANTVALMLTPILRNVIPGPVPLALIDKPTPGTGGSLLAEVVSLIATGSPAGMMSAPRDDEEVRKQITSALMRGNLVVTLDNVDAVLSAPSLSRALTSEFWEDRILGRSEMIRVPQRATWVASGNNLQVGGDLPRRGYWIRLDARVERPWERGGFRHPNLKPWVAENRARLVSALLTMGRAWFAEGKPVSNGAHTIGGFEGWSHTIGGVLEVAGVSGFLSNLSEMYERAADGTRDWSAFLEAWRETYADKALTTKQVAADLHDEKHARLRDALPDEFGAIIPGHPDKGLSRKLGKAFSKREGRRQGPDGLHLARAGSKDRAVQWTVRPAPDGPKERMSLMSLMSFSPLARARPRAHGTGGQQTQQTHQTHPETEASGSEQRSADPSNRREEPPTTPRGRACRKLTDEEAAREKRLIAEGMTPRWARKTILASDHPLDCECEVCA